MRTWTDGSTAPATTAVVLAVLVALARHLAKPGNKPQLVFVANAGPSHARHQQPAQFRGREPRAR
jgi:hypothetical protein